MAVKLYRSKKYRMAAGLCAGIAIYKSWPISLVRLAAIGLSFLTGIACLIYLISWFLVPLCEENSDYDRQLKADEIFYRTQDGAIFAGLCSAIAKHFQWDVSVVRVFYVILALMGGGLFLGYIFAWIVIPLQPPSIEKNKDLV